MKFAFAVILISGTLLASAFIVYAQEQGYLTNGKERMRADASPVPASDQLSPQMSPGTMLGAADTNSPRPVSSRSLQQRQRTSLDNQLEEQVRQMTIQQDQLMAQLQDLRRFVEDKNEREILARLEPIINTQQQITTQRRAWFEQWRAQRNALRRQAAGSDQIQIGTQTQTFDSLGPETAAPDAQSADPMTIRQQNRRQNQIQGLETR